MKFGSTVSMKMLNWDAVMPKELSKDCVWSKFQKDELPAENVFAKLAENFCSKPNKQINYGTKPHATLRVIDGKTAQALLILLRVKFKDLSHEEGKQYILRCDSTMLNVDIIDGLIKCIPQPHQIKQIEKLKDDRVKLVDAEEFLAGLCEIKRLVPRLKCIKFKLSFNDIVENLEPNIKVGIIACKELIKCEKLTKILNLILSLGNFMNSNKVRAIGFELPILTKLNDIKDTDNKRTLMDFIVETIESQYPEILNFVDDLIHLNKAARLNIENIKETIQEIKESTERLEEELEPANVSQLVADDKFGEIMEPFSSHCCYQLKVLTKMMKDMQDC